MLSKYPIKYSERWRCIEVKNTSSLYFNTHLLPLDAKKGIEQIYNWIYISFEFKIAQINCILYFIWEALYSYLNTVSKQ